MSAQSSTATRRSNEENAARIEELHADGVDKELAFPKAVFALFTSPSQVGPRRVRLRLIAARRIDAVDIGAQRQLPRDVSAQPALAR